MNPTLTPIERCAEIAGLRGNEIILGVSPGAKHERMLTRYGGAGSRDAARARLVAEIREALHAGAKRRAADLLIVLRRLLAQGADPGEARASRARRRGAPARARRGAAPFIASAPPVRKAPHGGGAVLPWRRRAANPVSESVI